jgi:hypothetical protein
VLGESIGDLKKLLDNGGLDTLDNDEFVEVASQLETLRRVLATVDYPVIAQVRRRDLSELHLTRDATGFLAKVHRLDPGVARGRVREADHLAVRVTLTGEVLDPLLPYLAAARQDGTLSAAHVTVIIKALDALPSGLSAEQLASAEKILVDAARSLAPKDVRDLGVRLKDTIDPDGDEPDDDADRQRRRDAGLRTESDGMVAFGGRFDAETGAKALTVIGALAKPRPEDETGKDERTGGQRRHDAFAAVLDLALRANELTPAEQPPVTVHVTMTAEQFETRTGHAVTSYGQQITVAEALRLADQAAIAWLVHDTKGGVLTCGRKRRFANADQIDALIARDGGCAFPGCDHPAEWCQRHHIREWIDGGPSDIDNLVLLCGYHHRKFVGQGWRIEVHDKIPWFIPPPWIDPDQKPLRNIRGLTTPWPPA